MVDQFGKKGSNLRKFHINCSMYVKPWDKSENYLNHDLKGDQKVSFLKPVLMFLTLKRKKNGFMQDLELSCALLQCPKCLSTTRINFVLEMR